MRSVLAGRSKRGGYGKSHVVGPRGVGLEVVGWQGTGGTHRVEAGDKV